MNNKTLSGTNLKAVACIATLALCGCAAVPEVTTQARPTGAQIMDGATNEGICIVTPVDASFDGERYSQSGAEIAKRVAQAIRRTNQIALIISWSSNQDQSGCNQRGIGYILTPTIVHYEDNYTGWSGKPDRIVLTLSIAKADDPTQTRAIDFEARSNLLASAILEWGNAKPTALLREDFDFAVSKLLAK